MSRSDVLVCSLCRWHSTVGGEPSSASVYYSIPSEDWRVAFSPCYRGLSSCLPRGEWRDVKSLSSLFGKTGTPKRDCGGLPQRQEQHSAPRVIGFKVFISIYEVGGIFMGKDGPFSSRIMVDWISLLRFFFWCSGQVHREAEMQSLCCYTCVGSGVLCSSREPWAASRTLTTGLSDWRETATRTLLRFSWLPPT